MAFTDSAYGVFQGTLYAARRTMNGPKTGGWLSLGDCDQFIIDPKPKYEDIKESQSGLGFTAAHVITETDLTVKLQMLEVSQANWERAIWGTASGQVVGAAVGSEPVTIYPGPSMVPLAHPGVSSVTVSGGALDTDYTVDAANGALLILAGSPAFTDPAGTAATVSYTFDTYTGSVEAYTTQQPVMSLLLHGINTANSGQPTIVECYQWAADMSNTLDFIGKKHMMFQMGGMLLQDKTKPLASSSNPFSQFFKVSRA